MITPSPKEYSYLEVHRPVVGGDAKRFIAGVREVGRRVLGEEVVTSITDWAVEQLDDDQLEPYKVATPVTEPKFKVNDAEDLSIVLLHRGVPRELASRYDLTFNALQLERPIDKYARIEDDAEQHRAEVTYPPLGDILNAISTSHGVDPEATEVVCDMVSIMVEPGDDFILTLAPRSTGVVTRVLHEQAKESQQRLARQSRRLAIPVSGSMVSMPFARMPQDVSDIDSDRIISGIQSLMPKRFVIAEPRVQPHP